MLPVPLRGLGVLLCLRTGDQSPGSTPAAQRAPRAAGRHGWEGIATRSAMSRGRYCLQKRSLRCSDRNPTYTEVTKLLKFTAMAHAGF